ncbi:MAG: hypothetical protein GX247_05050 [Mollicutes bacterium]|nr:hypothetical protein [Mollicutes bacterium]
MREVELTIQVLDDLESVIKKIEVKGFKYVKEFYTRDYYMIHKSIDLMIDNYKILQKCILLRERINDNSKKQLVYKNKIYDIDGKILSQKKNEVNIESIEKAKEVLEAVDFICLFKLEMHYIVYKKNETVLFIQEVIDPNGLYIEIEATENELLESDDEKVKEKLKKKLDELELKTTGDYEVKKAIIALEKIKEKEDFNAS